MPVVALNLSIPRLTRLLPRGGCREHVEFRKQNHWDVNVRLEQERIEWEYGRNVLCRDAVVTAV